MRAFSKVCLLATMALVASAAVATSSQAVSFNPDTTAVSGVSSNMNLSYGVAFYTCDNATMNGNTSLDSDRIPDIALAFDTNCSVAGVGSLDVSCVGDVTLLAEDAVNDTGTLELNDGFECSFNTALCSITVAGPQTTQSENLSFDETNDVLSANVDFQATRAGSAWCGPSSGTATFAADYATSPENLTIDP